MIIRIDDIKPGGLQLEYVQQPESFPALKEMVEEGVVFDNPLRATLKVVRCAEMIEVEGTLETSVRMSCGRCLMEFDAPLSTRFELSYVRELPTVEDETEGEIELDADEMGLILVHGDEIDFSEVLQEQAIMAIPYRPLCHEECRGLCPYCGANLNEAECGCAPQVFNSKFAALKNFKVSKEDKKKK